MVDRASNVDRARRKRERGLLYARILGAVGRTMITAGVLILLFVTYQLWGTGVRTAQAQERLDAEFQELLEQASGAVVDTTSTTAPPPTTDPTTPTSRLPATTVDTLPPELLPARGDVAGQIRIPRIGVDFTFVEGVGVSDLKEGPGHYPETPLPGQTGNSAIAGHRTTYGAPFANVDQLEVGDEIVITTVQGEFTYLVGIAPQIVAPDRVEVLDADHWDFDGDGVAEANVLTLTACHPRYSARQRIIIAAELVGEPAVTVSRPAAPDDDAPAAFEEAALDGERAGAWPAIFWAAVAAVIWLLAWAIGRWRRRLKWPSYLVGILPFLVALFFLFENFSRLLPANY
ncbi:MAG: class E sortase [Acidimicrobiia bacterium]|nr:class E sortase [Acidimicrobiia bacterium]